jgi:glucosamine--fructose-6-phosphate aminotransferase (isomerizing)
VSQSDTYREILNQPRAWEQTLVDAGRAWDRIGPRLPFAEGSRALFVGAGTSLYLAQAASQRFQELTGVPSAAVPPSEVFLSPASTIPRGGPLAAFVISRSGATSEALHAARHLREHVDEATVVALTCEQGTRLEEIADHAIVLPAAAERAIAMTQSFTSMLLALELVAARVAARSDLEPALARMPGLAAQSLPAAEQFGERLGRELALERFVYLGLGPNQGLAQEGTLKLKELTQTPCEAYNPLEFRHGPISIVRPGTAVVVLGGERERAYLGDLTREVKAHGASVATVSPFSSDGSDLTMALPAGDVPDVLLGPLYLPPLQLAAYYRALALGLDPDRPRIISKIVVLAE